MTYQTELKITNLEKFNMQDESYQISDIWTWIAELCIEFCRLNKKTYTNGYLTVSFPLKRESKERFVIQKCGKDFSFQDFNFINADPLEELNRVCRGLGFTTVFKGVMNDSVSSLIGAYYQSNNALLAVVLGTGTNCSFLVDFNGKKRVINSEWASFYDSTIIKSHYDTQIISQLEKEKGPFKFLDVVVGGLRLNEYIKLMAKDSKINIPEDFNFIKMIESDSKLINFYKLFKKRAHQIISSLIVGTLLFLNLNNQSVIVCLNGSGYENKEDRDELKNEIDELTRYIRYKVDVKLVFMEDASLIGAFYYTELEYS